MDRRQAAEQAGARRVKQAVGARLLALPLEGDPVRLGRVLLVTTGSVVTVTMPLLGPPGRGWLVVAAVSVVMTGVLLLSLVLPWAALPRQAALVFPGAVVLALAALGLGAGLGASYGALLVLCFACTGLTQSATTNLTVVPVAAAGYVATLDTWSAAVAVRLLIVTAVWVLLSQLLAALTARQHDLAQALRKAAHTDALTGLPNRRDLQLQLAASGPADTVVLCDLDHFKQLNDTLGHQAGDRVLAEFGMLLRTCLRTGDYAARYGGEEFALLLPQITTAEAGVVLARLRDRWALLQPAVTFSAGLCQRTDGQPAEAALDAADRALYTAKAAGRNRDSTAGQPRSSQAGLAAR